MAFSLEFKTVMGELTEGLTDREVAEACGISQPYVNQVRNGKIPSMAMCHRIAEGLALKSSRRGRLFAAAGYNEIAPIEEGGLSAEAAYVGRLYETLPKEAQWIVRRLLEDHPKLRGAGLMLGIPNPGVIYGDAIGA